MQVILNKITPPMRIKIRLFVTLLCHTNRSDSLSASIRSGELTTRPSSPRTALFTRVMRSCAQMKHSPLSGVEMLGSLRGREESPAG